MRVVLDANVLVSFLLTKGPTISKIVNSWKKNEFTFVLTDEIFLEVKFVLARFVSAKLIQRNAAAALLRRIKQEGEIIIPVSQVNLSPNKKDNRYLEAAKDSDADFLVTGDKKHLLPIKRFGKTKILLPKEFVKVL